VAGATLRGLTEPFQLKRPSGLLSGLLKAELARSTCSKGSNNLRCGGPIAL